MASLVAKNSHGMADVVWPSDDEDEEEWNDVDRCDDEELEEREIDGSELEA